MFHFTCSFPGALAPILFWFYIVIVFCVAVVLWAHAWNKDGLIDCSVLKVWCLDCGLSHLLLNEYNALPAILRLQVVGTTTVLYWPLACPVDARQTDKNGDRWIHVITRIFWSERPDSELLDGRAVGGGQRIQPLSASVTQVVGRPPTSHLVLVDRRPNELIIMRCTTDGDGSSMAATSRWHGRNVAASVCQYQSFWYTLQLADRPTANAVLVVGLAYYWIAPNFNVADDSWGDFLYSLVCV